MAAWVGRQTTGFLRWTTTFNRLTAVVQRNIQLRTFNVTQEIWSFAASSARWRTVASHSYLTISRAKTSRKIRVEFKFERSWRNRWWENNFSRRKEGRKEISFVHDRWYPSFGRWWNEKKKEKNKRHAWYSSNDLTIWWKKRWEEGERRKFIDGF